MQGKAPRACGHYIVAIASLTITDNMGIITESSSFQGLMRLVLNSPNSWKSHPDSSSLIINALPLGASQDVGFYTLSHTKVTR